MILSESVQWFAFLAFSFLSVAGALGMATTMSMFRSGILLMASFIGVAGLFILLSADLLSLLQVMMYIGGMLVMVLFMVLFSHDPGGAMMAGMDMARLEKFFSLGITPMKMEQHGDQENEHGGGHGTEEKHADEHHQSHEDQQKQGHENHGGMDMSMTTPVKRHAAALAAVTGALLIATILARHNWPTTPLEPNPHSAHEIGSLLMDKYMMAFEGAGLLILLGIFGAVFLAHAGQSRGHHSRALLVAEAQPPARLRADPLRPTRARAQTLPTIRARAIHDDERHAQETEQVPATPDGDAARGGESDPAGPQPPH